MKKAKILMHNNFAGVLVEDHEGFHFTYLDNYLNSASAEPISLTLPLSKITYTSTILFPFFDGLIPEGWLLEIALKNWKLDLRDRMGILLVTCKDCIGDVSVEQLKTDENE
jgi:serine/threonine-protein kinase HipA